MSADGPPCHDCGVPTELGTLLDFNHVQITTSKWHAGIPEPAKFLGLKTSSVKLEPAKMLATVAYRCPQCGLLRLYAGIETATPVAEPAADPAP